MSSTILTVGNSLPRTGVTSSHSNLASAPEDLRGFGNDFAFPGRDGRVSVVDIAAGAMIELIVTKALSWHRDGAGHVFTSLPYI